MKISPSRHSPIPHILWWVTPRVLGRSGEVRAGHWQAIHRPSATECTLTSSALGGLPGLLATPATPVILLETRLQSHPSPAGSSLAETALYTSSLTHSSHPLTAELSPNIQTFGKTDMLGPLVTFTLRLTHSHTRFQTIQWGGGGGHT